MPQESVAYFFRRFFGPSEAKSGQRSIRSMIPFKIRYDFLLLALAILCPIVLFVMLPAVPQPQSYHDFADKRPYFGIPHFFNVISNIGFLWAGYRGRQLLASNGLATSWETRSIYQKFFALVFAGGIGSTIYHIYPNDMTLFFDRFPMILAVAALFSAIIAERVSSKLGFASLYPSMAFAGLSTLYWGATEICDVGDLRPYALCQALPVLLLPFILMKSKTQGAEDNRHLWKMAAYVGVARMGEWCDWFVYQLSLHLISGHTVKHIFLFLAILEVMLHVQAKKRVAGENKKDE